MCVPCEKDCPACLPHLFKRGLSQCADSCDSLTEVEATNESDQLICECAEGYLFNETNGECVSCILGCN